jgi:tRNA pseudouridine32 synthase/23S rRNA pseudouridine746 synthase
MKELDVGFELAVLHQDDALIAVDKPSGLLAVPGRGPDKVDSLATRVQMQFPTATVVHRLDWETSGVMLMALDRKTHRRLSRQFEERRVSKRYIAVVAGVLADDEGEINLPLANTFEYPPRHVVDHQHGREAITRWRVLQRLADRTRVELAPATGRSHQLRVHMAHIGHAILGDVLYADERVRALAPRLLLHAAELTISHPQTRQPLTLRSACPF